MIRTAVRRVVLPLLALNVLIAGIAAPLAAADGAADPPIDPWLALRELRLHLASSGDLAADFRQRYVPAGFADGDEERGRITVAVPDCLRWDYVDPYPKVYLLCGARFHSWVPGEPQGQRMQIDPEKQAGLDLLLLPSEDLAKRYSAKAAYVANGRIAVELTPLRADVPLAGATIELDRGTQRPTAIAYRDRDGNETRFGFGEFSLVDDPAIFTPPPTMQWKEP